VICSVFFIFGFSMCIRDFSYSGKVSYSTSVFTQSGYFLYCSTRRVSDLARKPVKQFYVDGNSDATSKKGSVLICTGFLWMFINPIIFKGNHMGKLIHTGEISDKNPQVKLVLSNKGLILSFSLLPTFMLYIMYLLQFWKGLLR
jgi:hypothetical protein